jgi:hypothetical protein
VEFVIGIREETDAVGWATEILEIFSEYLNQPSKYLHHQQAIIRNVICMGPVDSVGAMCLLSSAQYMLHQHHFNPR